MKKNLKRVASFVIALGVALSSAASISAANFSDVPSDSNYAEAVSSLSAIGILNGYEDGSFKPDSNITRAEVAAVVVRALAQETAAISSKGATAFTDVAADHWASGYVNVASSGNNAFINGMGDGTFAPDANVTYAQIIKMLVSGIGYGDWGVSYGGYPTGYITAAKILKITDGVSTINADEAATRGTVAKLTYNAVNTPLLALETYSPSNPEYIVLDGADGRAYETPLTYYHNIYTVEGRIIETNKSGDMNVGQVRYQIESTKNYGPDAWTAKKSDSEYYTTDMYIPADIDPDAYLNVYSKALVYVDDDEEATMISIVASAKNQTVVLDTKGWDEDGFKGTDKEAAALENIFNYDKVRSFRPQMYFYADGEKKGKSSRYNLSYDKDTGNPTFKVYVNGVEIQNVDEDTIRDYIFNNKVGTITLVDTPSDADASVSTDGRYDAMYITYYQSAVVDSLSKTKMNFGDREALPAGSKINPLQSDIKFEWDDDDYEYTFIMDGKEIDFKDIQEGDVVSIASNPTAKSFKDSNFYTIIVSRKTVEGRVNELNDEDGEIGIGDDVYTPVNNLSGYYKPADSKNDWDMSSFFTLGSTYTAYIDAFDRVVSFDKSASSRKYGIVELFYEDPAGSGEYRVKLCDSTGSSRTLDVAKKFTVTDELGSSRTGGKLNNEEDIAAFISAAKNAADPTVTVSGSSSAITLKDFRLMDERVVSYETNASGEIKKLEFLRPITKQATVEYKKNSDKLGGMSIGSSTVILSKDETSTDLSAVNKSALKEDTDYVAFGFGKESGDDYYPFILIANGIGSYNKDTRFAVVDKVTSATNDSGDECCRISFYSNEGGKDDDGYVSLFTEDTTPDTTSGTVANIRRYSDLDKGDIIVYKVNANNEITDCERVFSMNDIKDPNNFVKRDQDLWSADLKANISSWASLASDDLELIVGPVVDRSTNSVSIAQYKDLGKGDSLDGESIGETEVVLSNVSDFGYASDISVYVYDYSYASKERLFKGSTSDISKVNIPKDDKIFKHKAGDGTNSGRDYNIADLDAADNQMDFAIAIAKVEDNDTITDLLIIIPDED